MGTTSTVKNGRSPSQLCVSTTLHQYSKHTAEILGNTGQMSGFPTMNTDTTVQCRHGPVSKTVISTRLIVAIENACSAPRLLSPAFCGDLPLKRSRRRPSILKLTISTVVARTRAREKILRGQRNKDSTTRLKRPNQCLFEEQNVLTNLTFYSPLLIHAGDLG